MPGKFPQGHWSAALWDVPIEVAVDGRKIRNDWQKISSSNRPFTETSIFDGIHELDYSWANRQASVYPGRTGREMIGINNLRFLPRIFEVINYKQSQIVAQEGGTTTFQAGRFEVVADDATGFISRCTYGDTGQGVTHEWLQYSPVVYPGGIIFPTTVFDITYENIIIKIMSIYYIHKAILNNEIPEGTFVIDAPKGTNIVDFRKDRQDPTEHAAIRAVPNVLQFVDQIDEHKEEEKKGRVPRGILEVSLFVLVGIACIYAGLRLWPRAFRDK